MAKRLGESSYTIRRPPGAADKRVYTAPVLQCFGCVAALTHSASTARHPENSGADCTNNARRQGNHTRC